MGEVHRRPVVAVIHAHVGAACNPRSSPGPRLVHGTLATGEVIGAEPAVHGLHVAQVPCADFPFPVGVSHDNPAPALHVAAGGAADRGIEDIPQHLVRDWVGLQVAHRARGVDCVEDVQRRAVRHLRFLPGCFVGRTTSPAARSALGGPQHCRSAWPAPGRSRHAETIAEWRERITRPVRGSDRVSAGPHPASETHPKPLAATIGA